MTDVELSPPPRHPWSPPPLEIDGNGREDTDWMLIQSVLDPKVWIPFGAGEQSITIMAHAGSLRRVKGWITVELATMGWSDVEFVEVNSDYLDGNGKGYSVFAHFNEQSDHSS